jgi:hypothetical protein
MAAATDQQIREKIAAIIAGATGADAQVYRWNALSHNLSDYPSLFRTSAGLTHGWIIKRASGESKGRMGRHADKSYTYDIWGFYGFRSGTESDNSDNEFGAILDEVTEAFVQEPKLQLSGGVRAHDLLQYAAITTIDCGEEILHFAQGRLTVHLCC